MKDKQIFVDTNILVYAHDRDSGERYYSAREKIEYLWNCPLIPAISVQVLQEFYVNLIKKNISTENSKLTVINYLSWKVIDNSSSLFLEGIRMKERWCLSFWDALIVAAAKRAKASVIWSEDFNPGQEYEGIIVENPLLV